MLNAFAYNYIIEDELDMTYINININLNPYVKDLLNESLNYNNKNIDEKQKDNKVNLILQGIIK